MIMTSQFSYNFITTCRVYSVYINKVIKMLQQIHMMNYLYG